MHSPVSASALVKTQGTTCQSTDWRKDSSSRVKGCWNVYMSYHELFLSVCEPLTHRLIKPEHTAELFLHLLYLSLSLPLKAPKNLVSNCNCVLIAHYVFHPLQVLSTQWIGVIRGYQAIWVKRGLLHLLGDSEVHWSSVRRVDHRYEYNTTVEGVV